MKLKKDKYSDSYYASSARFSFQATPTGSGLAIKASAIGGGEFELHAKTVKEADKVIAEFYTQKIAEYWEQTNALQAAIKPIEVDACAHVWVDQPVNDRLNTDAIKVCSVCNKTHFIPRSN